MLYLNIIYVEAEMGESIGQLHHMVLFKYYQMRKFTTVTQLIIEIVNKFYKTRFIALKMNMIVTDLK